MTWFLLAPDGSLLASGSWMSVIEQGWDEGVIKRCLSRRDGSEACPKLRAGYVIVPAAMCPNVEECVRYG